MNKKLKEVITFMNGLILDNLKSKTRQDLMEARCSEGLQQMDQDEAIQARESLGRENTN